MNYLGVDYGKKKVGLAISEGITASPLKVLGISGFSDAILKIRHIIKSEGIDELIVGVPESGEARNLVKKFIVEICKYVTVVELEETLSSFEARRTMIALGKGRKERKREDAYSATLILQNYLDSINEKA